MILDSSCCFMFAENLLRGGDFFCSVCTSMRRTSFKGPPSLHPPIPSGKEVIRLVGVLGESEPAWFSFSWFLLVPYLPAGSSHPSCAPCRQRGPALWEDLLSSGPCGYFRAQVLAQPAGCRSTTTLAGRLICNNADMWLPNC